MREALPRSRGPLIAAVCVLCAAASVGLHAQAAISLIHEHAKQLEVMCLFGGWAGMSHDAPSLR
jgi:hypothetical protein